MTTPHCTANGSDDGFVGFSILKGEETNLVLLKDSYWAWYKSQNTSCTIWFTNKAFDLAIL